MGVNIRDITKSQAQVVKREALFRKVLAVDAMNWIYQFLATIREPGGGVFTDHSGRVTSHLVGLFYRNVNFLTLGIKPVYVFDGKPPERKLEEIKRRKAAKAEARTAMKEAKQAGDLEAARKFASRTSHVTSEMLQDAKTLLSGLGIPVLDAPEEGEAQSSHMAVRGDVWAVASQDYDCFLFGAPRLVRNLNVSQTRRVGNVTRTVDVEVYSLEQMLQELELAREQLVDVGLLVGTDYHEGAPRVGAKTALKLVKQHGSLEAMLSSDVSVQGTRLSEWMDLETYREIRAAFLNPKVTDDYVDALRWRRPNLRSVREFLVEQRNFDPNRVTGSLNKLQKTLAKGRPRSLDEFLKRG
ncbi:MAG: flap endonuclease-1 [Promethearchaeota archaeon]